MTRQNPQRLELLPDRLEYAVREILQNQKSPVDNWSRITSMLRPFPLNPALLRQLWDDCFRNWDTDLRGPAPMWIPSDEDLRRSNLAKWIGELKLADYQAFHDWSIDHREEFWRQGLDRLGIRFHRPPRAMINENDGPEDPHWLPGAELNIAESCFQAAREAPAIVVGKPGQSHRFWTYSELLQQVQRVAAAVRSVGFQEGAALSVVLPMTAESVAIYLGVIWAGCAIVSIADSFAPTEIASRLRIASAKAVFTYDYQSRGGKTFELYDRVCHATAIPIIVLPSGDRRSVALRSQDLDWYDFLEAGQAASSEMHVAGVNECVNVLFSSGTTGEPKAIPWSHLTPIKCAIDGYCHQDIQLGTVAAWPTNLGWMMGPWLIFATLINRGTIALYEDVPTSADFGRFVEAARVNMLGVVPTIVKNWRSSACMESFDWSSIHVFSSTGESSQRDDMFYLSSLAGMRPIIEYCGGTEIGGGFISSTVVQPNFPGAFACPAVGSRFLILDDRNRPADEGELFLIPPTIGLSQRLLNRDHHKTYYAGTPKLAEHLVLRRHGDHFRRLPGGVFVAGGRIDDTMNLGGIKVSSAELERVINRIAGVRESAAVAFSFGGGPEELVVFIVPDRAWKLPELLRAVNDILKTDLNPLFRAREVRVVDSMPRTASNKVMRRELRGQLKVK